MTRVVLRTQDLDVDVWASLDVPDGWAPPREASGRIVLTAPEPNRFFDAGFLPNVTAILERSQDAGTEETGGIPLGGGHQLEPLGTEHRTRVELTTTQRAVIGQLISTCRCNGYELSMVCSAALESWPTVASEFDAMAESLAIGVAG